MSATRDILEVSEALNAAPDDPPEPDAFQDLDVMTDDDAPGETITVFFDGDAIEDRQTWIRDTAGLTVELGEVR